MKLIVDNLALEYEDTGSGKVLLFLHGWGDNLHSFDALSVEFVKDFRIVRIDLPGFGKSQLPKEAWGLDNYINLVNNFIQKLNLEVYALVGHSFGGRIIIKGIAEGKLTAEKIILIGSAGIARRKTFKNFLYKSLAKIGKGVTLIPPLYFYRDTLRKKMYNIVGRDYLNAGKLKETFVKVINEDLVSSAQKIQNETLLIWGENDTETPLSDGKRLAELITNSKLEVIKDAGHFVHKEKSNEVLNLIRKFL